MSKDYEQVEVTSEAELRTWLAANHQRPHGVWLVTYKRSDPQRYVSYEEIVRAALCFGWIDGQARGVDDHRTSLLLTPRSPRSAWSRPNKIRVTELIRDGLMTPAGLAAVEAAKASGTWTALDDVEALVEPPELAALLDARPDARRHWDAFPRSVKRATLEWISTAKRPATRTRRISETVELAVEGRRANQWPR